MRDRTPAEAALPEILAGMTESGGADRFSSLARHLAAALGVRTALAVELDDAGEARLLGSWCPEGGHLPEVRAAPGTVWARVLEQGAVFHREGLRRRYPADASLEDAGVDALSARALRDAEGIPAGLVAVLDGGPLEGSPRDNAVLGIFAAHAELLLRKARGERQLSRVAREWTSTMDAMPEMIAVVDPAYRLVRVNQALARFASAHPRQLVGQRCHRVLHGLDSPWPACPHAQALREGRSVTREVLDPSVGVPLLVTCTPFHDDGGRLLGTVHVARDISAQLQASQLRESLIKDLQEALAKVKLLGGLLPICSICKRIRDDEGYWEQVEVYIRDHSEANFTHGLCPDCVRTHYPDYLH